MLNPSELRVLGLTNNQSDAVMLKSTLDHFQADVRQLSLNDDNANDLTIAISEIISRADPHIVIILVSEILFASKILAQAKEIALESCTVPPYWSDCERRDIFI